METAYDVVRSLIGGAGPYVRIVIPVVVVIVLLAVPLAAGVHRFRRSRIASAWNHSARALTGAEPVAAAAGPGATAARAALISVALFLAMFPTMAFLKEWDAAPEVIIIVAFSLLAVGSLSFAVVAVLDGGRYCVARVRRSRS